MKTLEDLQYNGLKIYVDKSGFTYGRDAVLLANFAKPSSKDHILDLGTGTGILPLLLYGRAERVTCDAVEIQQDAAERAQRSMQLNGLENEITVHCQDLRNVRDFLPHGAYDLVICNPPYSEEKSSLPSPNPALRGARQEGLCTLQDIAAAAAWLLRSHARFSLMLPVARLTDAFEVLSQYRLEPKRLRLVHANEKRPARLALIEAMMDVHSGLIVEPPLLVKNMDGSDSDEVRRIYHME